MHVYLSDEVKLTIDSGRSFTAYEIFLNGIFHSLARYRQFFSLYEELKTFDPLFICDFPPKILFPPPSSVMLHRKLGLQKFLQTIASDPNLLTAPPTIEFFAYTRQAYLQKKAPVVCELSVRLLNETEVSLKVKNTDPTDDVLRNLLRNIGVQSDLTYAFGIFLMKSSGPESNSGSMLRQLHRFECPLLSLQDAVQTHGNCFLLLRKCCFSRHADDLLLEDETAGRLLYMQALHDTQNLILQMAQFKLPIKLPRLPCEKLIEMLRSSQNPTDIRTNIIWLRRNVQLLGFLPIQWCSVDFFDNSTANIDTTALSRPNSFLFRPAQIYIGCNKLLIFDHRHEPPGMKKGDSLEAQIEDSPKLEAEALAMSEEHGQEPLHLSLCLPLTKIHGWKLTTPENCDRKFSAQLIIEYSDEDLPNSALETTINQLDPLGANASQDSTYPAQSSSNFEQRRLSSVSFDLPECSRLRQIRISSDQSEQIFLLNNCLLQLIEELERIHKKEHVFDTPNTRLPWNYLFNIQRVKSSSSSLFSSSSSSSSQGYPRIDTMRNAVVSSARVISGGLRRIFDGLSSRNTNNIFSRTSSSDMLPSNPKICQESKLSCKDNETRFLLTTAPRQECFLPNCPRTASSARDSMLGDCRLELRQDILLNVVDRFPSD